MICKIHFVTGEHDEHLVDVTEGLGVLHPLVDALEGLAVGDVVSDDNGLAVFDVGGDQTLEFLLASCVPEVERDDAVLDVHFLSDEVDADGGAVVVFELVVLEPLDNRGLAHALVAQEDDFERLLLRCH
eukprot:CAMPEP_0170493682 /NCGR_PEP_ID=MMETSP0208-20121228/14210_1 /TAXON_ID=197538 /ORGANISM="Strombidium inclinatum, Strain S3" /LENGTH=128 /DNA_ID=CAMNT_0010769633 /DNA_START=334 /DNA_END=717 /DNA_ORIENTATION=+